MLGGVIDADTHFLGELAHGHLTASIKHVDQANPSRMGENLQAAPDSLSYGLRDRPGKAHRNRIVLPLCTTAAQVGANRRGKLGTPAVCGAMSCTVS